MLDAPGSGTAETGAQQGSAPSSAPASAPQTFRSQSRELSEMIAADEASSAPLIPGQPEPEPAASPAPSDAPSDPSAPAAPAAAVEGESGGETAPPAEDEDFEFSFEKDGKPEGVESSEPDRPVTTEEAAATGKEIADALLSGDDEKAMTLALRTSRGKRMLADFKAMRELEKDPAEGGIGFKPTSQQITDAFSDQLAYNAFLGDLTSGDPQKLLDVTNHLLQPGEDGRIPAERLQSIQLIPAAVRAVNPVAYHRLIEFPVLMATADAFTQRAGDESLSQEQREQFDYVANGIRFLLTGKIESPASANSSANGARRPGRPSPERDRLEQENQNLRQMLQESSNQAAGQLVDHLEAQLSNVASDLLKELIPDAVRSRFSDAVLSPWISSQVFSTGNAIQQDPRYYAEFSRAVQAFAQQQTPDAFNRVVDLYRNRAAHHLKMNRKTILQQLQGVTTADAAAVGAAASRARVAEQQREPISPGAPSNGVSGTHSRPYQLPERTARISQRDEIQQMMQRDSGIA